MADGQRSAKEREKLAPESSLGQSKKSHLGTDLIDSPSKFEKLMKPKLWGTSRKRVGAGDVVTVGESEFLLVRQVGGESGEVSGKSETWFAKTVGNVETSVFLKKFNTPKYPTIDEINNTTEGQKAKKNCEEFAKHHQLIMMKLGADQAGTGALVKPIVFGRPSDSLTFVKVYPWVVEGMILDQNQVIKWSVNEKVIFIRTLCLAIWELHSRGIVHGDIKRENVIVVMMPIGPVARLIDFDDSYLSSDPPISFENLFVGTTEFTPEWKNLEDPTHSPKNMSMTLGLHTDIFQLSVMLNKVFSENDIDWIMPSDSNQVDSDAASKALMGAQPRCSDLGTTNSRFKQQLEMSLYCDPKRRPSIASILSTLGVTIK